MSAEMFPRDVIAIQKKPEARQEMDVMRILAHVAAAGIDQDAGQTAISYLEYGNDSRQTGPFVL
jgi:hypothetical protein